MEPLVMILILAAVGEAVIEVLKPLIRPAIFALGVDAEQAYLYLSTVLGLLLAFIYGADILAAVGLSPPNQAALIFGQAATGLILGRGSKAVHDAINRLSGVSGDTYITANIEESGRHRRPGG